MKMRKLFTTAAEKLALRFSLLIAVIIIFVSSAVLMLLRENVRMRQSRELVSAMNRIAKFTEDGEDRPAADFDDPHGRDERPAGSLPGGPDLPYYITYSVYDGDELEDTNDPFLPRLPDTKGRPVSYRQKDFYIDGDLDILYCAEKYETDKGTFTVQTSINMDRDTSLQLLSRMPVTLSILFLPLLFISYFAALLITRRTMRPVVSMTKAARRISSVNLEQRLPSDGSGDELDTLADTFNDLFSRLKKDFDSERQFTSNVSHELKTPLAVILGQANLIRRWGKDDPAQLEKSTSSLIAESHSMESIINNLLQLSRLENGTVKPDLGCIFLLPLCRRLARDTHAWSPSTVILFPDVREDDAVTADDELLYQVLTILVSNSVKFSPAPVSVTVGVQHAENVISVCVRDSGPGFSEEILPFVFDRFFRGDPSHNRNSGGSGLGLSIAKEIVSVMGGSVAAGNTEDHHALITVYLPAVNEKI